MRKTLVVLALLGLAVVPAASAHVEPSPEKVPADSVSRITLSVEGEENVPAVKLTVQMPAGVTDVVAHPAQGWRHSVNGRLVTWSGGRIPHGAEGKFQFSAQLPEHARTGARVPVARDVRGREGRALDRRGVVGHAGSPGHADGRHEPHPASASAAAADHDDDRDTVDRQQRQRQQYAGSGSSSQASALAAIAAAVFFGRRRA